MFEYSIFLNCGFQDKKTVHALAKRMKNDGLPIWPDTYEPCGSAGRFLNAYYGSITLLEAPAVIRVYPEPAESGPYLLVNSDIVGYEVSKLNAGCTFTMTRCWD